MIPTPKNPADPLGGVAISNPTEQRPAGFGGLEPSRAFAQVSAGINPTDLVVGDTGGVSAATPPRRSRSMERRGCGLGGVDAP